MPHAASASQPFRDHLQELRSRILVTLGFLVAGSIVGYFLHDQVLSLLVSPLSKPLYYSSPAGGFDFTLKLSVFFGLIVSIPVLVYQTLQFLEPAFSRKLKHSLLTILAASCLLLLIGMAFAYFISLPAALYFLDTFSTEEVHSLISTTEYFSFVSRYLFGFGLLFQLPLVLLTANKLQPIPIKSLLKQEKWVVLASFIVAAVLTPTPDIFNQSLMAGPLIVLYQLSIGLIWLVNQRERPVKS